MTLGSREGLLLILAAFGVAGVVYHLSAKSGRRQAEGDAQPIKPRTLSELDAHMPAAEAEAVTTAMEMETNAANLTAFANSLLPDYPIAAEILKTKASVIIPAPAEEALIEQRVSKTLMNELRALDEAKS